MSSVCKSNEGTEAGSVAEPREIERVLIEHRELLEALDCAVARLTERLYSVLTDEQNVPFPDEVRMGATTELGNSIDRLNGTADSILRRVNSLVRNCELP